jgi:phosphoserine phosphatase
MLCTHQDLTAVINDSIDSNSRGAIASDCDGTVWSGDIGEDVFVHFMRHGDLREPAASATLAEAGACGVDTSGAPLDVLKRYYEAFTRGEVPEERMYEVMVWCFGGWRRDEVVQFVDHVLLEESLAARIFPEMHALLDAVRPHTAIVLVSGSPDFVIKRACHMLGVDEDHVVAARSRWHGDVMLADVERPITYAHGKVVNFRAAFPDAHLHAAFGDSGFDYELLAESRFPVMVRPKQALRDKCAGLAGARELVVTG